VTNNPGRRSGITPRRPIQRDEVTRFEAYGIDCGASSPD
jgi:hypothetical protein